MQIENYMKYIGHEKNNSWLLSSEKSIVIECLGESYALEHLKSIKEGLNGKELDYILLNHTSPENTGSLKTILNEYPNVKVIASAAGIKNLTGLLNTEFDYEIAKDEKVLDLGDISLKFLILPNLPWTDSMATYCESKKALFCGSIFSDRENYFNEVIRPYRAYAKTAVERLKALDIKKLLPISGDEILNIDACFDEYSAKEAEDKKPVIFYSSHYGYTAQMAHIIAEEFEDCLCFDADTSNPDEIEEAINNCSCFMVGTNTINRNCAKAVWNLITNMDMVNKKYTPCFVFGSCGWSGEGVYLVERFLKLIRMNVFEKPYLINFKPSDEEIKKLREFTRRFKKFAEENKGE